MKSRLFDRHQHGAAICSGNAGHGTIANASSAQSWSQRVCIIVAAVLTLSWSFVAVAAEEFSTAERALFMTDHLGGLVTPATLRYTFRKSGSLEENFEDKVTVALKAQPKAQCCTATTEFLGGARRVKLPEVESAPGNPVILYFLEREIHEMQRLTKGQPNYFRKRIRMAVFQGAQVSDVEVPYRGRMVAAQQIVISPYSDDPLRARYEKLADKQYIFTLSKDVPGGIYAIRARVSGASPEGPPLMAEEIVLDPTPTTSRETSGTPKQ
jgi:hypothetical protein